ncbi:unnamed protein product [Prunus brigantina]
MEDLHSLLDMRGGPSIFVWEVRCKSSRTFSLRLTDLWSGDFSSFLLSTASTQPSSIFLACEFLHPLSSGMHPVLYNCFLDCLVALPIAARQQIAVVILLFLWLFFEVLDSFFDYSYQFVAWGFKFMCIMRKRTRDSK